MGEMRSSHRTHRLVAMSILCLGLALTTGCTVRQHLQPTEGDRVLTVGGDDGAGYRISFDDDQAAEVVVGSDGIRQLEDGGCRARFSLAVENLGRRPLQLPVDAFRLDCKDDEGWFLEGVAPTGGAAVTVAVDRVVDHDVDFILPDLAHPRRVTAVRLHWRLAVEEDRYQQVTPFIAAEPRSAIDIDRRYAHPFRRHPHWRSHVFFGVRAH